MTQAGSPNLSDVCGQRWRSRRAPWDPEHPDVARSLKYYAVILRETGRKLEAKDMEARAESILAKPANRAAAHSVTVDALIFEKKSKSNK